MSEATNAIYDVPAARIAGIGDRSRPALWAREAREDKPFYVPDYRGGDHQARPEAHAAGFEHAKHLRRAEALLDDTLNLVRVLSASQCDEGDSRAMQVETMLDIIETKLEKARDRVDRHATRYNRLFLAYYELEQNR